MTADPAPPVPDPAPRRGWAAALRRGGGHLEEAICYGCLVLLVVVVSLQVFTRYLLAASFTWTEEAARILFIWMVLFGAALVAKRSAHISIDFFVSLLPPAARRRAEAAAHLVTLAIVAVLGVTGVRLLAITGSSASPALGIPWAAVYAALPLAMGLLALRTARALARLLRPRPGPASAP
jgi:TRAP-type C4-dicarboxylate transport system permease small subunit